MKRTLTKFFSSSSLHLSLTVLVSGFSQRDYAPISDHFTFSRLCPSVKLLDTPHAIMDQYDQPGSVVATLTCWSP